MPTTRLLLLAAALLGLTACGSNELTVRGSVVMTEGAAAHSFRFDNDTRLGVPEGSSSVFTGRCEMAALAGGEGAPAWGVVVDLMRGGDEGFTSLTVMQRTDAAPDAGRVEAELNMTPFTSSASNCSVEVEYADAGSGMVGLLGDCEVADDAGDTATISLELDLVGCTVIE